MKLLLKTLLGTTLVLTILNSLNIIRWRWIIIFTPRLGFLVAILLIILWLRRRLSK